MRGLKLAIILGTLGVPLALGGCATTQGSSRYDFDSAARVGEYSIYFDFRSAALSSSGSAVIDAGQKARPDGPGVGYIVSGHTDTYGAPDENIVLSRQRAEALAAHLSAKGVSRDRILVRALGESEPASPTADGVRDPLNRRVVVMQVRFAM